MKTLRTFIIMVVLIIGGMAMTGCEDSNATNNPESVTTNGQSESQTGEKPLDSSEKKQVLETV